jgi:hypothetical protein
MSNLRIFATVIFTTVLFVSCVNDSDPDIEEEVITTMTVTLVPDGDATAVVLFFKDLDGDGPNAPDVDVSGSLVAGVTYNGSIELLNETEDPAEDITEEVEELDLEHQVFYTVSSSLEVSTEYINFDSEGGPLGTKFTLTADAKSNGKLTFTLRHEPNKNPENDMDAAGGATDIDATFDIEVIEEK